MLRDKFSSAFKARLRSYFKLQVAKGAFQAVFSCGAIPVDIEEDPPRAREVLRTE